jgi:2'-5' RNA ligase
MFVAVVPSQPVIDELAEFIEPRQVSESGLRWASEAQWHLTLAFLPSVADLNLDELTDRLTAAASRQSLFDVRLSGAGCFPDPDRAKVLWSGVTGDTEALQHLAGNVRTAAAVSGLRVDATAFTPHLTLARLNRPANITRWLRIFDAHTGPAWTVSELELMESHLGEGPRGRPRYETRAVVPFP